MFSNMAVDVLAPKPLQFQLKGSYSRTHLLANKILAEANFIYSEISRCLC